MQPLGDDEPTVVGPYRLLGRLGSGGMGRVYLGRSAGGRTVAVKIVHPHFALDEEFRARFRREVDAARRVGGAWTAPVLDADPEAAVPWVATAYAAGPSLSGAVADGGPLPTATVRALGAGLAEALTAVHELGLVHRDVKPSNVLLTLDGPLLIDFGIARATDGTASLTSTGVSVGSPGYMAPEQILGKGATGASDVFSLGAVLAYAATGESPFPGDSSAALLYKVVHEEPQLGEMDGELRELALACLVKDPAARPTPGEVARRLAPDGAVRLVAGGWLPGALVEQVSRSAVQLLNLEAAGVAEGVPSGPVGFSSPSLGSAGSGAFGPPPVMPLGAPTAPPFVVPEPRDALPHDTLPPDAGRRSGKVSLSLGATAAPGADRRGRKVSCALVVVVAGFAAVVLGPLALYSWLPGDSGKDTSAGSATEPTKSKAPSGASSATPSSTSTSAATDVPSPAPTAAEGTPLSSVPAVYLGTWEGEGTALGGTLPDGTFRITVAKAGVGQQVGILRQTDQLGGVCEDVLTLKRVTKTQLVASAAGAKTNRDVCNQAAHTVTLTPVGDDLKYVSDSSAEGSPTARMSKVG
ncbi:serine/threonine protein kinase [Streptomyces sp. MBT65]|uniref:serine/threonine-protein kinase n=1 Tax=Streptomyces sp. MBT65 TaxID=1488395 RepID=UPI00190A9411|nr:serine/threonine-protein kinase [Streptomyces sp. MBT65]MBK3574778.1 serine/threonine protein kinase [Streptomyces sp. MBT65]